MLRGLVIQLSYAGQQQMGFGGEREKHTPDMEICELMRCANASYESQVSVFPVYRHTHLSCGINCVIRVLDIMGAYVKTLGPILSNMTHHLANTIIQELVSTHVRSSLNVLLSSRVRLLISSLRFSKFFLTFFSNVDYHFSLRRNRRIFVTFVYFVCLFNLHAFYFMTLK